MTSINNNNNLINPSNLGFTNLKPLRLIPSNSNQVKQNLITTKDSTSFGVVSGLVPPNQLFNNILASKINSSVNIEDGISKETVNAVNQVGGTSWIGRIPSNGNREVAVILPEGIDKNKPVEVIYYFHGRGGKISKSLTDSEYGLKDQINYMTKVLKKNVVFVVPQGPQAEKSNSWMKASSKENMADFQDKTLNIIKNMGVNISSVTLKGHSAGGVPIMNGSVDGKLIADRIDFLDASYGSWATTTVQNCPTAKINIFYKPNTQTETDARRVMGKSNVSVHTANVSHSSFPKVFLTY